MPASFELGFGTDWELVQRRTNLESEAPFSLFNEEQKSRPEGRLYVGDCLLTLAAYAACSTGLVAFWFADGAVVAPTAFAS